MSIPLGVAVTPTYLRVPVSGHSAVAVTITNQSTQPLDVTLRAGGIPAPWLSVLTPAARLAVGATERLVLELCIPDGAAEASGTYRLELEVLCSQTAHRLARLAVPIEVVPAQKPARRVASSGLCLGKTQGMPALVVLALLVALLTTALGTGGMRALRAGKGFLSPAVRARSQDISHRQPLELPRIVSFELRIPSDAKRGEFELVWDVQGAEEVLVDGRPQPGAGTMRVQARDDRQVALEARNAAGSVASTIGLLFLRPPEIRSFQASAGAVARGQPVTLTWDTVYATRVTLNGRPVEPGSGSLEVQPDQDTTYTLVAENELGRAERRAVVQVRAPAPTARR